MLNLPYPVVLASASPRRRELLSRMISEFEILPADLDETVFVNPVPWQTARDSAAAKAAHLAKVRPEALVIGGDTVVAIPIRGGYEQLAKPTDARDAERMLTKLSGIQHLVITGVCLIWPGGQRNFEVTSGVTFRKLEPQEIREYADSGESLDKAGAYAVQGKGASFIESIDGSLTNVIGLPLEKLREELQAISEVQVA